MLLAIFRNSCWTWAGNFSRFCRMQDEQNLLLKNKLHPLETQILFLQLKQTPPRTTANEELGWNGSRTKKQSSKKLSEWCIQSAFCCVLYFDVVTLLSEKMEDVCRNSHNGIETHNWNIEKNCCSWNMKKPSWFTSVSLVKNRKDCPEKIIKRTAVVREKRGKENSSKMEN